MAPMILYAACVLGALGLYLLLRPGPRSIKVVGTLLGLGALAWVVKESTSAFAPGGEPRPEPLFVLFSLIAIASAVRMITHHRPIYAALYFVMVVLSSAGLFLLLEAEFMAFALVIVYAGAILITYLFVLMLAHQASQAGEETSQPEYDRVAREPAAAAVVGFVMLALLGDMIFDGAVTMPPAQTVAEAEAKAWDELEHMPERLDAQILKAEPDFQLPPLGDPDTGQLVQIDDQRAYVVGLVGDAGQRSRVDLPESAMPENVQRVGWWLVRKFPVSLELAGVILLMAMFGAVVMARRQIELSEDEKREAAGAPRMTFDEPEAPPAIEGEQGGGR